MLTRRELLAYGSAGLAAAAAPAAGAAGGGRLLRLPLDHTQPAGPQIEIGYEWGKPFRADQRTVLLVVDGQQFYLRPGAAADLQSKLFGDGVNLLAFFGRASSPQLRDYVRPTGKIDWHRAAHVLNIHQWIGDLKAVADALELPSGALGLYGRSGGADLTLRFLASHPSRASRAYVQAAVTHDLGARWKISADHFWEELIAHDRKSAEGLAAFLVSEPEKRREAILLLQRQNFFEPLQMLNDARVRLIEALIAGNRTALAEYRSRYQLDALEQMQAKGENLTPVRLYEFSRFYSDPRKRGAPFKPDVEAMFYYAEPMTREIYEAAVKLRYPSLGGLRVSKAEVLIAAGRYDHTSDYRTQIALAGMIPRSEVMLLNDDHVFKRFAGSGHQPDLLQAFFTGGPGSERFRAVRAAMQPLMWDETV